MRKIKNERGNIITNFIDYKEIVDQLYAMKFRHL